MRNISIFTISGYRYPEITTKKPYFVNISTKTKIFLKIFWRVSLGPEAEKCNDLYFKHLKKLKNLK